MTDKSQAVFHKLKKILDNVAEAENIENYTSLPDINQIKGEGFLSEFFTGKIVNQENKEVLEVAIKVAPVENPVLDYTLFYNNEVHFYSVVFPELNKFQKDNGVKHPFDNIPKYFTGTVQPENKFVAMENLKSENYDTIDKTKYLSTGHLELIFKTYGKFHALSLVFKQRNPEIYQNLLKGFGDSMGILVDSPFLQNEMKDSYLAALKAFDPVTEAQELTKLKKLEDIKKTLSEARNYTGNNRCLTHGDCWSNNMLFKYKGSGSVENVKLIDFQLMCESTPIHDLSYFFYSGACKADMDKLDQYLNLYYTSFCNFATELGNLDEIFSLDDIKEDWKKYSPLGLYLGLHLWLGKLTKKDDLLAMIDGDAILKDHHKMRLEINEKIRESKAFKERGRNICLHAVEYGIV